MKDDKKKKWSCLRYWDVSNLYGWVMYQKLPVNSLEWIEETSQFNEDFSKNYNEETDKGIFLAVGFQQSIRITRTLLETVEYGRVEKLGTNLHDKNDRLAHIRN